MVLELEVRTAVKWERRWTKQKQELESMRTDWNLCQFLLPLTLVDVGVLQKPDHLLCAKGGSKWNSWRLSHHLKANEIRDSMKVLQRWLPLPFGPPTSPNGKHKAKGILGSVVRPTQVDALQSTSLLGSFSSSFSLSTFTLIFLVHIVRIFPRKCMWK